MKAYAALCFCLFLLTVSPARAQTAKAYKKAAESALEQKDYQAALQHFAGALQLEPDNPQLAYSYAEVARHFHAYEAAEEKYLQVLESKAARKFPLLHFKLGEVNKRMGNYDRASAHFQAYLLQENVEEPFARQAKKEIADCRRAEQVRKEPARFRVENLGRKVNTDYSEFGPLQRGDTLYYSSFRFDKEKGEHQPPRKITKVLIQYGRGRGRPLRRSFNADNRHTAHTAFSLDGRRLYFTRCDYLNASEIRCALYYREKDSRGRWEREAQKLPETINLPNYTATQPSLGYDSILQAEVLFWVSERPGGAGGLDIWWAAQDEEGQWQEAKPLLELNTPEDDITPFFDTKGQRLFFSSQGYPNLGGFDIYYSEREEGWKEPVPLEPPINSSYNDIYYSLQPGKPASGYFSSNRPGSFYLDEANKACCNDIYYVEPLPEEPPAPETPVAVAEPPLSLETPLPEPEEPEELEDFLPLALYFDNDEPGRRTRRTSTKKAYGETFETYYSRLEEYQQAFAEPLSGERREEAAFALESFFEDKLRGGYELLGRFSEILLQRLREGEQVEIFLKGYTSPRARSDYNLALSKRRISSLRNHFQSYKEGAFQPYLESGQLLISERPFGEAQAARNVSDALDDLRNSIYHPDAARERRVEIVEVKRE